MPDSSSNPPPAAPTRIPPFDPRSFVETALAVLTSPQEFFKGVKAEQGFVKCLLFSIPIGLVAGVLALASALVHGGGLGLGLGLLVQYAIGGLLGPFIAGLVVWGISLAYGSKVSFEPSVRIAAYASAVAPIAMACTFVPWIGWIGALLAVAYGVYLMVLGAQALNFEEPTSAAPPPAS
jgi:hypothetical protein